MMHIAYHASHEQFEAAAEFVSPADMIQSLPIFHEPEELRGWMHSYLEPLNGKGKVDTLILHNVHPNQEDFLADFKWMKLGRS